MNKKAVNLFLCFLCFLSLLPIMVSAASATQNNFIEGIINRFLSIVVWPLFIGLVIVMLIWAAALMLTAQGDESKLATARKAIIWAVIGIIVAIVAFSAVKIMKRIVEAPMGCNTNGQCVSGGSGAGCTSNNDCSSGE